MDHSKQYKKFKWDPWLLIDTEKKKLLYSKLSCNLYLTKTTLQSSNKNSDVPTVFTCGDLDPAERQHVLIGKSNGEVTIHDVNHGKKDEFKLLGTHKPTSGANAINHIEWYPVDSGLFTSSQLDQKLSIWDPNILKIVESFNLNSQIIYHSMSPVAANHSLVATGLANGQVTLCDLRIGSKTHCFQSHTGKVAAVQWDPTNQFRFASGGDDGKVCISDTRYARPFLRKIPMDPYMTLSLQHPEMKAIKQLLYTPNGTQLTSFRKNGILETYNTASWKKRDFNFNFESLVSNAPMCSSTNTYPDLLYIAINRDIYIFDMTIHKPRKKLTGHCDRINGVIYNTRLDNLYSFGRDGNFLVWEPLTAPKDLPPGDRELLADNWDYLKWL